MPALAKSQRQEAMFKHIASSDHIRHIMEHEEAVAMQRLHERTRRIIKKEQHKNLEHLAHSQHMHDFTPHRAIDKYGH